MSGYQDGVPAYLTIRVTRQDGPVAAFADQEAWLARDRYPEIMGLGVGEFFHARELESGGWELSEYGGSTPQQARDGLGSHFRRRARSAEDAGDAKAAGVWMAAALRMDREVVDELRVRGERFRIVRAAHFVRMGDTGPEPPRPSDPDPGEVGEAHRLPSRTKGFVVDPFTGTGMSEGILKLDLVRFVGTSPGAPPEVTADAAKAVVDHPGGVLLPAVFVVSDRQDGCWGLHTPGSSHPAPQGCRDALASWLRVMAPFTLDLDDAECEEYARAADTFEAKRTNVLSFKGHRFRVTRVERLVRIGPDGPEGPRPADFDPEPPVEVQTAGLRAGGRWEDDADGPAEFDGRALRLKALFDREQARRAAVKESRKQVGRGGGAVADG